MKGKRVAVTRGTDPFIFLFWIFIILTTFVWGRGLFCGWLCPFGSLSELIYKVAGAIGSLPTDVDPPVVAKADADATPIVVLNVSSASRDLLQKRKQILHRRDLLLVNEDNRVFKDRFHPLGIRHEVR